MFVANVKTAKMKSSEFIIYMRNIKDLMWLDRMCPLYFIFYWGEKANFGRQR